MFFFNVSEPCYHATCAFPFVFLNLLHNKEIILPSISLLILHILFLAGFFSRVLVWLMKLALWSFNVIKQLSAPFTSILSKTFAAFANLIPPRFILIAAHFRAFLYVDVIAFVNRCLYSSYSSRYMFNVLSVGVKVLFDKCTLFISSFRLFWNWFLTFDLILFTSLIRSSSSFISSFNCGRHWLLFKPYFASISRSCTTLRRKPSQLRIKRKINYLKQSVKNEKETRKRKKNITWLNHLIVKLWKQTLANDFST